MDWSPCGSYIAVGNKSDHLVVLDVRTGNQFKKKKFSYEVNEIAWTANSDYLLAAANSEGFGSIDLLAFHQEEEGGGEIGSDVAGAVATGSSSGGGGGGELELIDTMVAHSSNCYNLKIDPTFQRVAVGSFDQCISLWNLETLVSYTTLTME